MTKLTFIIADTTTTYIAIVHENQFRPYSKRIVQFELTPEQEELIKPRSCGIVDGKEHYEEVVEVFIENEEADR